MAERRESRGGGYVQGSSTGGVRVAFIGETICCAMYDDIWPLLFGAYISRRLFEWEGRRGKYLVSLSTRSTSEAELRSSFMIEGGFAREKPVPMTL